jgi:hypothetical protein
MEAPSRHVFNERAAPQELVRTLAELETKGRVRKNHAESISLKGEASTRPGARRLPPYLKSTRDFMKLARRLRQRWRVGPRSPQTLARPGHLDPESTTTLCRVGRCAAAWQQ